MIGLVWLLSLLLAVTWAVCLALGVGGAVHALLALAVLLALGGLLDVRRRELGL